MGSGFKWSAISAGLVLIGWALLPSLLAHAEEPAKPFNEQFGPFLKAAQQRLGRHAELGGSAPDAAVRLA